MDIPRVHMDEKTFRWEFNEDAMAVNKLSEGIRKFNEDTVKLHKQVVELLNKRSSVAPAPTASK